MYAQRIIPCLDIKDRRVVKGINFIDLKDAGDPVECAVAYEAAGADEIVFLDITATSDAEIQSQNWSGLWHPEYSYRSQLEAGYARQMTSELFSERGRQGLPQFCRRKETGPHYRGREGLRQPVHRRSDRCKKKR